MLGGYTWRSPWKLESIALCEGRGVVAGVGAGGAVFFDVGNGRRIREVRGDVHAGISVAMSADGATVAIGDEGGNLRIFDLNLEGTGPTLRDLMEWLSQCTGSSAGTRVPNRPQER